MKTADDWRTTLRAALKVSMRSRQSDTVAALRETLAAIDNAEAVAQSAAPAVQQGVIAGGVAGLGAGEVPRRALSPEEVQAVIDRELNERRAAAAAYAALGRHDEAERLNRQLEVLAALG